MNEVEQAICETLLAVIESADRLTRSQAIADYRSFLDAVVARLATEEPVPIRKPRVEADGGD